MANEQSTIEIDGEERPLDQVRFIQLEGTELTVYLPEKREWAKNTAGEDVVVEKGGHQVNFQNGIYPPPNKTIDRVEAELLAEGDAYGELYTLAREEQETPTAEEVREQMEKDLEEDEVMIDGQVMSKAEAFEYLQSKDEDSAEEAPSEFDSEPEQQFEGEVFEGDLTDLDASNRQEALEMLAAQGVDMADAPPASATTAEIQEFAVDNGFNIVKYDLPENPE